MLYSLEELQQRVEKILNGLEYNKRKPAGLYKPIDYIISIGGKRIRPVMLLMACNLFTDEIDHAHMPAAGIEVFHNFTLLHDDIMDDAPIRRNHPTVHMKWDRNTAILSGDAMSVIAFEYLMNTLPDLAPKIFPLFSKAAIEVCEGQQLDIDFESMSLVSESDYLKMIELKTSVLLAASFQIGAILGGASDDNARLLYDTGLNLGLAFQVQDDLLDTFGDQSKFGKSIGGDIVMNKKTFLMVKAMELAQQNDAAELKNLISSGQLNADEKIRRVKELYLKLGVKDEAEKRIKDYFEKALKSLENVEVGEERKKIILSLASMLMERNY
jgi:geranylgeranyl diphosphate synthase, type II